MNVELTADQKIALEALQRKSLDSHMDYTGGRSMLRYYIQPKRKMRPSKRTVRFETQPGYLQHRRSELAEKLLLQYQVIPSPYEPDAAVEAVFSLI